jgi:hypothetical protein
MANVIVSYRNILENSSVVVTTENASFPKPRLYDRDIGKFFKGTAFASPFAIVINQGAVVSYPIDRLIIPIGHNLSGLACSLRYSTDNFVADDHEAVGWTQGDAFLIDKSFTVQTKRYWKLNITAPATIVELPEIFLTKDLPFENDPGWGAMIGIKKNIILDFTQAGLSRKIKLGESKRHRKYDWLTLTSTQKTDFEAWDALCEGVKSFYLHDENAVCWFAELTQDLEFIAKSPSLWTCSLELLEVLG